MHETIRQFAQEQLRGSDQEADALERHARYYAELVAHAAENRTGQSLPERLRTVQDDHDNVGSAFEWLIAHDREQALALVAQLGTDLNFWELGGFFQEGRRWLQRRIGGNPGIGFDRNGHKPCWQRPSFRQRSLILSMGCSVFSKRNSCFSNSAISGEMIDARLTYCDLAELAGKDTNIQAQAEEALQDG